MFSKESAHHITLFFLVRITISFYYYHYLHALLYNRSLCVCTVIDVHVLTFPRFVKCTFLILFFKSPSLWCRAHIQRALLPILHFVVNTLKRLFVHLNFGLFQHSLDLSMEETEAGKLEFNSLGYLRVSLAALE